jgi:hypothetical protein
VNIKSLDQPSPKEQFIISFKILPRTSRTINTRKNFYQSSFASTTSTQPHQSVNPSKTMHISTLVFVPVTAYLASSALAAECYSQGGANECGNRGDLYNARTDYCNNHWGGGNQVYYGTNGWRFTYNGFNIPSQQQCWDSTQDIIDTCLGHKNGGSYSQNGWNVNINFCG